MHAQDLFTPSYIRAGHDNLTVEATGAQQGGIEHVGPIGGGDEDHTIVGFEPIHLHQQLVERLFPLVMPAPKPGAAMAPDGIDFVDENDARGVFFP